jgi:hypothetical protein
MRQLAMRQALIAAILIVAAAALTLLLLPETSFAQSEKGQGAQAQPGQLPQGFKQPPAAPVKPYTAVAVKLPSVFSDASFDAFRKQLGIIAEHKDRAALAKLIVAQGFFWMQDRDVADKKKPGIANLASAIDLDGKDGAGWELLVSYASEPTAEPLPDKQNVICAPAEPSIDSKAFEALVNDTKTQPPEWGYPLKEGVEVRGAAKPDAPVIEKLGLILVRVLPDNAPDDSGQPPQFLHVATPSGKAGYVPTETLSSLGGDQMCYTKDGGAWKITGYFGGAAQ